MNRYKLIDTTLREGEQTPGVLFTHAQKKHIVKKLVLSGIDEIELGVASTHYPQLPELISHCREKYPEQRFSLWSRCLREDIEFAALHGIQYLSLSIPVSDLHLYEKLEKNRKWAEEVLEQSIHFGRRRGLEISVGFEDATRAEPDFVLKMARAAEAAGAFRVRLADTVGIASPGKMGEIVRDISQALEYAATGVHTHNDFGMATGNAIAALENGATWADGALLGLGERTGCAALEQLAAYLAIICNDQEKNIELLKELAVFISEVSNRPISANLPVFGSDIFTCETGLHLQGLLKEPKTYEPFPPEKVGATRKLMIGAKSGKYAVQKKVQLLGQAEMNDHVLERCVKIVRQAASELGRSLSNEELLTICKM